MPQRRRRANRVPTLRDLAAALPRMKEAVLADGLPIDEVLTDWNDPDHPPPIEQLEEHIAALLAKEGMLPCRREARRVAGYPEPVLKTIFYRPTERLLLAALQESHPIILATTFETQRYVEALIAECNGQTPPRQLWIWKAAFGQAIIERADAGARPRFSLKGSFKSSLLADAASDGSQQAEIAKHIDEMTAGAQQGGIEFEASTISFWWRVAEETSSETTFLGQMERTSTCIRVLIDDGGTPISAEKRQDAGFAVETAISKEISEKIDEFRQFAEVRPCDSFVQLMNEGMVLARDAIVLVPDAHHFVNFDSTSPLGANTLINIGALKDAYHRMVRTGAATKFILLCGEVHLPKDLREEVSRIDLPLPGRPELYVAIRDALQDDAPDELVLALSEEAAGMTRGEVHALLARERRAAQPKTSEELLALVRAAKQRHVARSPALELVETSYVPELGGMEKFNAWLKSRQRAFNHPERARAAGINRLPRGVLLLGIPGSGKSLAAKVIAREWGRSVEGGDQGSAGLPLVRLDMGALQDVWVGSSEARVREALRIVEAMAPCILWIDEIDKGVAQDSYAGSATLNVRATLLTWMQESRYPVFIVATANRFDALPPELTRAGRFDARFFFGCPGPEGRCKILEIHLATRGFEPANFDLDALVEATHGFTGAEIEQVVLDALYKAFEGDGPLTDALLMQRATETQPLIRSAGKSLEELWDLIENGRVELASKEMLTHAQVAQLINPHLYRPIYCRLETIEGFDKQKGSAQRLLMASPFGGPAAIVMETGEKDWAYVQTNFPFEPGDAGTFKFLDRIEMLERNFVFDTLVSDHSLETIYFETTALREAFEKSDFLSAYVELFSSIAPEGEVSEEGTEADYE